MEVLKLKGGKQVKVKATSGKGKLSLRDIATSAILSAGTPLLVILQQYADALSNGNPFTLPSWKVLAMTAIGAGSASIIRNLIKAKVFVIKESDFKEAVK